MSAADPLGALRTYLLADTGVNTATAGSCAASSCTRRDQSRR
jgi:hypothetical protein